MSHDPAAPHPDAASTSRAGRSPSRNVVTGTLRFFGPSLIIGLMAPFIFPGVRRAARPVAKGLIKGGLLLGESFREAATEARENVSDLLAEVRSERELEQEQEVESGSTPSRVKETP